MNLWWLQSSVLSQLLQVVESRVRHDINGRQVALHEESNTDRQQILVLQLT